MKLPRGGQAASMPFGSRIRASQDANPTASSRLETRDMKRRILLTACLAGGASLILGCQPAPLPAWPKRPRRDVTIYLIARGWHTEIALPVRSLSGPLWTLTRDFPGASYISFGWGEREYYMAQQPGPGGAVRALFPGPAVLLVTPLGRGPQIGARVFAISLSTAGLGRLADYVLTALDRPGDGTPRRLAAGPDPGSVFYAATGTYSAAYTCNTWTAEGLRVSGLPVSASGVVFAGQVVDQVQALSEVHR